MTDRLILVLDFRAARPEEEIHAIVDAVRRRVAVTRIRMRAVDSKCEQCTEGIKHCHP